MSNIYLIIIALILQYVNCGKLNNVIPKEMNNIFNYVAEKSTIVPVAHTLHKKDVDPMIRIRAFQKDYELYLTPNDNILFGKNTPVYLSYKDQTKKTRVKYIEYKHDLDFQLYHNITEKVSLLISHNIRGHLTFHGTIDNLLIRPIPENSPHQIRRRRSIFNDPLSVNDNEIYTEDHEVIKINSSVSKNKSSDLQNLLKTDLHLLPFDHEESVRMPKMRKRDLSTSIYPEILVVTDYKTFSDHDRNIDEFIKYMVVFWNGVDLKFRTIQKPRIRLNVAGLIIPQELGATPYIDNLASDNTVIGSEVIFAMAKFFYIETKLPMEYDVVIAVTNNDMLHKADDGYSPSEDGVSYYAQACNRIRNEEVFSSVGCVEDNNAFNAVLSAAHELGHLFGALHDGDNIVFKWIPGAEKCSFKDGYIMSYYVKDERSHKWSPCSLKSMEVFLNSYNAKCLRNKPKVENPYPKFLPGVIASAKEQCKALRTGPDLCLLDNVSICHQLYCKKTDSSLCTSTGAALEGSVCNDNNGICILGKCVDSPKNFPS